MLRRPAVGVAVRRAAVLAITTTLTAALSACSSPSGTASDPENGASAAKPKSAGPSTPPAPPPRVGQCRDLEFADISRYANSDKAVRCSKPHTAYTFAVDKLAADIAFEGVDIANDAVQEAAARACRSRFARFVGGDDQARALSRLSVTYFVPDQRNFDRGAAWVRCDVIALRAASSLAPLPDDLRGLLDDADSLSSYGVCSAGDPGRPGSRLVMCSEDHTYRARAALRLGGAAAPYPGEQVTKDDGMQQCADLLAEQLGKEDGYSYAWTFPTSSDWAGGQRFGYCWHKTDA